MIYHETIFSRITAVVVYSFFIFFSLLISLFSSSFLLFNCITHHNYAIEKYLAEHIGYNAPEIYEVPSKAEPMRRQLPLTRQLTGALLKERRNFLEDELARLKITRRVLSAKTGVAFCPV